jgi:hypothetical protein
MRPTIIARSNQRSSRDTRDHETTSAKSGPVEDFRTHPAYHEQRGFSSIGHGARKREVLPPC